MRNLLFTIILSFFCVHSFSQNGNITQIDTLTMDDKIHFDKTIVLSEANAIIITSYKDFRNFLKILKSKVFNTGYMRSRRRDIKSIMSWIKNGLSKKDTIFLSDSLRNRIGIPLIASYLAEKIEIKRVIIFNSNKKQQLKIIREKFSYRKDFLESRKGRKYYFLEAIQPFMAVTDQVS